MSDELTTQLAARTRLAPPTSERWTVTVLAGPDRGRVFALDGIATRRATIGTSPSCDVVLSDRAVSRRHAALAGHSGRTLLADLDSRNGTWMGEVSIREIWVGGGAVVRVGDTVLRLDSDGAAHSVEASTDARFGRVAGVSPEMRVLYPFFERVARSDVAVLIEGETGTGKEALAESLHEASPRAAGPFVVLDCTTVAPALLESELFGHERGAFTGATDARVGVFEAAGGGTLFVDEIGDLELPLQAKLLRAIERKEIKRVGSNQVKRVDVRIFAATRRDLEREIQARRFRDDLHYRLAVARLELPPLRRREGDVAFLARYFWRSFGGDASGPTPDVVQRLEAYDWPGNVRELANAVARLLALGELGGALPSAGSAAPPSADFIDRVVAAGTSLPVARQRVSEELEARYVQRALELHGNNVTRAAAASGVGRRYFQMLRAKR